MRGTELKLGLLLVIIYISQTNAWRADAGGFVKEDLQSEHSMQNLFNSWTVKHKKFYNSTLEKKLRFRIFKHNAKHINAVNSKNKTFFFGLNKFADLSAEEFKRKYLTSIQPQSSNYGATKSHIESGGQVLESVDWVSQGAVVEIKNQGSCGSCWAFSTVGAVESINYIANHKLVSLSEQELLDCAPSMGCKGGYLLKTFDYIKNNGLVSENTYSYKGMQGQCQLNNGTRAKVMIAGYVTVQQNEVALQTAVAQQPVSICIDAQAIQHYQGGIFDDSCGTHLNHAALMVGYGTSNGIEYWSMKNSWGTSWGENGYIRFKRNTGANSGICGITMAAAYPTMV